MEESAFGRNQPTELIHELICQSSEILLKAALMKSLKLNVLIAYK